MITFNKKVGRILEDAGAITHEELQIAMETAEAEARALSSVLVEQELVDEGDLLGILAEHAKVPPIDLRHLTPDPAVLDTVPQETAFSYGIFPVSRIGNILTIALTNPFDVVKLDDVRIVTGCELRLVLTLDDHLALALDKGYRAGQKEVESLLGEMDDADLELACFDSLFYHTIVHSTL